MAMPLFTGLAAIPWGRFWIFWGRSISERSRSDRWLSGRCPSQTCRIVGGCGQAVLVPLRVVVAGRDGQRLFLHGRLSASQPDDCCDASRPVPGLCPACGKARGGDRRDFCGLSGHARRLGHSQLGHHKLSQRIYRPFGLAMGRLGSALLDRTGGLLRPTRRADRARTTSRFRCA